MRVLLHQKVNKYYIQGISLSYIHFGQDFADLCV